MGCAVVACGVMFAADSYRAQIEEWRQQREAALQADGGWLTVPGLFWLHEGVEQLRRGSCLRYRFASGHRR